MLYEKTTSGSVSEVVDRLIQTVQDNQFGVMGSFDMKAKMAEKGVAFESECVILEVCNPRQAKRVLEENLSVSTALPCRLSVYAEGDRTRVATIRPTALIGLFGQSQSLMGVANEVEQALIRIIDAACQ